MIGFKRFECKQRLFEYKLRLFGYKLRLFKYILIHKITFKYNRESINNKIAVLHVKRGDYHKAIKYYEEVLLKANKEEYYYLLLNLYIMSNETCKIKSLMNNYKCHSINDLNPMVMIDRINDTVNKLDKFNFINDYVKSKGATPLFVVVVNRGVRLDKKSPEEKELLSNQNVYIEQRREWLKENNPPEYIKGLYKDEEKDKIKDLYSYKAPVIKATKVISSDFSNSLVTVSNGLRRTKYQPENYNRKVLFFGSSTTFSSGVSDQDTLVSQIQKKINASLCDIKVENHGVLGANSLLSINNLVQTKIDPDDVVVFFDFDEFKDLDSENIKVLNLNEIDRGNDFFIDLTEHQCHYSPNGNKKLAEEITTKFLLPVIKDRNINLKSYTNLDDRVFSVLDNFKYFLYKQTAQLCESGEMKEYLDLLDRYKPLSGLKVGSIAVNCNPITNGHMHLIKYASEQVDKLYVFVIEEDQSFFKFKDRFRLVSESTKHIENITVLPGGKFICTELTYPDYFNKEEETEVITDASMEAWFFCEFIANKLNIKTIFLGDEPTCNVTKQYNEKMQELLPEYGINVDIIDRISTNGRIISASTVRACLKNKDFEIIKELVPTPTYVFLKENYGN